MAGAGTFIKIPKTIIVMAIIVNKIEIRFNFLIRVIFIFSVNLRNKLYFL